jgi:hypothetical protein
MQPAQKGESREPSTRPFARRLLDKVHLRTNAKGEPLAFELTGGEAHEVKGYEALMKLYDTAPRGSSATRATTAMRFEAIWQSAASNP